MPSQYILGFPLLIWGPMTVKVYLFTYIHIYIIIIISSSSIYFFRVNRPVIEPESSAWQVGILQLNYPCTPA